MTNLQKNSTEQKATLANHWWWRGCWD